MKMVSFKLVTIICEPVLSAHVIALTKTEGATGSTITEVRGEGSGEKSSGEIPDVKTKIEIVLEPEMAEEVMKKLAAQFFEHYSLITYSSDISIIRSSKF